ncbi:MAG: zf-HC2 domain-containing protein [Actinobacteria bacterium]|nr:zf-HC2 domain-containing protein [Actinomycetota bacterium]
MTHPGDLLSALLDGELTPEEIGAVSEHLDMCAACRAELEATAAARTALRSLPVLDPPPGLLPGTAPVPRRRMLRPVWGWVAAGAAALALSMGLVLGTAAGPAPMNLDGFSEQHTARILVQPGVQAVRAVVEAP